MSFLQIASGLMSRIFTFKYKIIKWLKGTEQNKDEVRYRKSEGYISSESSRSSNASSTSSIKDKAIEGKMEYKDSLFRNGGPNYTPSDHNSQSGAFSKMLCQLFKQQRAPKIDIDVFLGNPLEYYYFMEIFKEVVEKRIKNPREDSQRLIKYTTGEAKDLIKHCM